MYIIRPSQELAQVHVHYSLIGNNLHGSGYKCGLSLQELNSLFIHGQDSL